MKEKVSLEIEGKTVEDAVKKALRELKLPRARLRITVLSEEQKGLFGMQGARPAKIRVTLLKEEKQSPEKG